MRKVTFLILLGLLAANSLYAEALKPRMVFGKYLWAEGVNPQARYLDQLMVKFFDEDMVRFRDGEIISTNGRNALTYSRDFLSRYPEIRVELIITEPEDKYQERQRAIEERSGKDLVDLFSFFNFRLPKPLTSDQAKALLADILRAPEVETAYFEPIGKDLTCTDIGNTTPNLDPEQDFKDAAPLGVDLRYVHSTFGIQVADGETSTETGIFERGCDTGHEDFTTITIITGGSGDSDNDHGTAVSGIMGACDENNVGCIGFAADHTTRVFQRNSPFYASTADVYNFANGHLIAGEATTSSWGYTASPMPAGQSCPCNPGQNGSVPPEYNAAVKAAIDAGSAAGILYCLSAGNGCVNLDDPIFGSTFDFTTGSIYVSAINSTGDHDASCFTDWGSRVTSCAWGDGITTLGYGSRFSGAGTDEEWYTSGFNGTSGAGPIVAGCVAVLNNLYRDQNAGANISATTMRSWLGINGTQPGNVTPGNIGEFPNLFGITAPDLDADQRTGWSAVIVPRNTNDADGTTAVLPGTLNSDPSACYWNWTTENESHFGTATPVNFRLYLDDVSFVNCNYASGGPLFRGWCQNFNHEVRGGRHTVRDYSDPSDEVVESQEGGDNHWTLQYVWNPRALTAETPLTFSYPPLKDVYDQPGSYYNCDGYSLTTNFTGDWDLFAVMSNGTAPDYDARIYSEAITSTNGFDDYEAQSSFSTFVDFVGVNQNIAGHATPRVSAVNFDGDNEDYAIEGETSTYHGILGRGRNSLGANTISAYEIMEAFEWWVDSLVPYEAEIVVSAGNANLALSVFTPDDEYFSRSNANFSANSNGAGEGEDFCFTPTQTGYHLLVVHKYQNNDYGETATFSTYLGKALPDIAHTIYSGWSHEIVIQQSVGSTPFILPATLTGNVSTNRINSGYINDGCANSPNGHNNRFYRDGLSAFTTGNWTATLAPGGTTYWSNQGPIFVFGGRHTISDSIDINDELNEWTRANNRNDEQFVWTPLAMSNQVANLTSTVAPNYRDANSTDPYVYRNVDGWRFTGNTHWSGAAICPTNASDDYNCQLYNPTTGSENGFDNELINGGVIGNGLTEWVVENGNTNGAVSFDMGVSNNFVYPTTPSLGTYRTWQCNHIQDLVVDANNGPFTLGSNQIIHVFDVNLTAGVTKRLFLDNLGAVDLGFALYAPSTLYGARHNALLMVNSVGDAQDESALFTPGASGRYGVVVFKNDLTDLPSCQYRFAVGGAPAAPLNFVIRVVNGAADPIQMEAHWDSVVTDVNGLPLNVDSYQLYYVLNKADNYPTNWVAFLTTTQATLPFTVSTFVDYFRMIVVAIDNNGVILASSPLPNGEDIRGMKASDFGRSSNGPVVPLGQRE